MGGASFGSGLKSGLIGAGIGAASGALLGGLLRGITDSNKGFDFWDGISTDEFVLGGGNYEKLAKSYNGSMYQEVNDELLKSRMFNEFSIKEGNFGIRDITTRAGNGYGMTNKGNFFNLKSGNLIGGYVRSVSNGYSSVHISASTTHADIIGFRAIAGHELIHAYHNYKIPNYNRIYSERVAYRYTANTYLNGGRINSAISTMGIAISNSFWGIAPSNYTIPGFVGNHPFIK